tara:strand:+ start:42 stop:701 length:660 start_codon:yes stop_codon:yes gene_type:complete
MGINKEDTDRCLMTYAAMSNFERTNGCNSDFMNEQQKTTLDILRKAHREACEIQRKNTRIRYYHENKEKMAEKMKIYNQANKEKIAERGKIYNEANKEKNAERDKIYREANKEKIAERDKIYREANKEKIAERVKIYREANKESLIEKTKEYRQSHKESIVEYRETHKDSQKEYYELNKESINEKRNQKIDCECGAIISRGSKSKHIKTKKHLKKTSHP